MPATQSTGSPRRQPPGGAGGVAGAGQVGGEQRRGVHAPQHLVAVGPGPQGEQGGRLAEAVADRRVGRTPKARSRSRHERAERDLAEDALARRRPSAASPSQKRSGTILAAQALVLGVLAAEDLGPVGGRGRGPCRRTGCPSRGRRTRPGPAAPAAPARRRRGRGRPPAAGPVRRSGQVAMRAASIRPREFRRGRGRPAPTASASVRRRGDCRANQPGPAASSDGSASPARPRRRARPSSSAARRPSPSTTNSASACERRAAARTRRIRPAAAGSYSSRTTCRRCRPRRRSGRRRGAARRRGRAASSAARVAGRSGGSTW